ncbi:MAG: NADH-quinone oxidoreductase subunit H [Polyangiales bacterium]
MNKFILLATIVKIVIMLGFFLNAAALLTWMERRQSAMMQDRVGPNRADINFGDTKITLAGTLHVVADTIKFFFKEDFVPPGADKFLHGLAPCLSMFPPLVLAAVIPFTDTLCVSALHGHLLTPLPRFGVCGGASGDGIPPISGQIADLNVGILYIFALAGMGIIGATIAGWSSDNKWSLFGGLRAASQLVSYEVAMGLSLVGALMVFGSIRLGDIAHWQDENVWGIFVQPLGFILFVTALVAETKRVPFDLPEGESEIVAGYLVEYSGVKFMMFYTGEYLEFIVASALVVAIYLGGYNVPFLHRDGITIELGGTVFAHHALPHLTVLLLQTITFFGKLAFICWAQMFIRWTLPRFRYDQLMNLGWRMLLPAALANIFLTGAILLGLDRLGPDTAEKLKTLGEVINAGVFLVIIFGVLALIFGFFAPITRKVRRLPTHESTADAA